MDRLVTIRFVAVRQTDTDRQTDDIMMTIADHSAWQYIRSAKN